MSNPGNRKIRMGTVISNKMDKTATVLLERLIEHPLYHRVIKRSKKLLAHDENNECQIGDKVSSCGDASAEQAQEMESGGDRRKIEVGLWTY